MNPYVISTLETQWRKDPSSRVFFRLAEEYRKGGVYDKAIEVCGEGIKHHPRYLPARVCLGRCRQALGLMPEAEEDYKEVLKITPDNPHALRGLASISFNDGRMAEALTHYEMLAIHDTYDKSTGDRILAIKERLAEDAAEAEMAETVTDITQLEVSEEEVETLNTETFPPEDRALTETPADSLMDDLELIPESEEHPFSEQDHVFEEEPALFGEEDLELVSEEDIEETPDDMDPLDLEFQKAMAIADQPEPDLLGDFSSPDETPERPPAQISPSSSNHKRPLTEEEESLLTNGLKHEKMEHYEAAQHIYRTLLTHKPGDPSVCQHLDRVDHLIATETEKPKRIRLLSNWLDKIKGVYYVS